MIPAIIVTDVRGGGGTLSHVLKAHFPEIQVMAKLCYSQQAVQQINLSQPVLLFIDLAVPTSDNFRLLHQLTYQNFFVVYCTAHVGDGRNLPCYGTEYLLKPIDAADLDILVYGISVLLRLREQQKVVTSTFPLNPVLPVLAA